MTDQVPALTDIVLTRHLQAVESWRTLSGIPQYSSSDLLEAANSAFALGCAVGIEFPSHVPRILNQTHPSEVDTIVSDCSPGLLGQIMEAQSENIPLGAELFLSSIFELLEEGEPVDLEITCNVLSIAFEYGCILSIVERRAGLIVRNHYDRNALPDDHSTTNKQTHSPDHKRQSLKDAARKLVRNYEEETESFRDPPFPKLTVE